MNTIQMRGPEIDDCTQLGAIQLALGEAARLTTLRSDEPDTVVAAGSTLHSFLDAMRVQAAIYAGLRPDSAECLDVLSHATDDEILGALNSGPYSSVSAQGTLSFEQDHDGHCRLMLTSKFEKDRHE